MLGEMDTITELNHKELESTVLRYSIVDSLIANEMIQIQITAQGLCYLSSMATKEENEDPKAQFKQLRYQKQQCNVLKTWLSLARKSVQPWSCLNRGSSSQGHNVGNSCEKERSLSSSGNKLNKMCTLNC